MKGRERGKETTRVIVRPSLSVCVCRFVSRLDVRVGQEKEGMKRKWGSKRARMKGRSERSKGRREREREIAYWSCRARGWSSNHRRPTSCCYCCCRSACLPVCHAREADQEEEREPNYDTVQERWIKSTKNYTMYNNSTRKYVDKDDNLKILIIQCSLASVNHHLVELS